MDRQTALGWLAVVILLAALTSGAALRGRALALRAPLDSLPLVVGEWWGGATDFSVGDLDHAGSDQRLFRTYRRDGRELRLSVAYWRQQDPGDQVYTMANSTPSDRWRVAIRSSDRVPRGPGEDGTVNRVVFQQEGGPDRELVHYYYVQGGRMVHRELHGKLFTVLDAVTRRRSDAALVRVASPLSGGVDPAAVEREQRAFLERLIPLVQELVQP
jgi:EpsI family protein